MPLNTANLGFEKQIWDAADKLRGNMDASEYKHVVLGLIFLKYISDSFEEKYNELVDEGAGFEEEKDEYLASNIFYVPENARWNYISKYANNQEIGQVIDKAMIDIENNNNRLKGILPKNFSRPELDKRRLGEVVDIFTNIQLVDFQDKKDVLGRTYEYCLAMFAEQEGRRAGEFYTPASIVRTLVEILKPYNGRVYDPACGAGGMFVQSAKFVENHHGNIRDLSVYGQESNPTTWKLAQMNLAIRGIEADLGNHNADTFFDVQHSTLRADYILANPPFNVSNWGGEKLVDDKRWKYGVPSNTNANFAWLQHMIYHLSPNGKIGIVLANGTLSSHAKSEQMIRENIIKDDIVECIISLPANLFYSTTIAVSLWIINKAKTRKEEVLFIDGSNLGKMVTRAHRELTEKDIETISKGYADFVESNLEYIPGFIKSVSLETIKNNDYILTPARYVGLPVENTEKEKISLEKLSKNLVNLFQEKNNLEKDIINLIKEVQKDE